MQHYKECRQRPTLIVPKKIFENKHELVKEETTKIFFKGQKKIFFKRRREAFIDKISFMSFQFQSYQVQELVTVSSRSGKTGSFPRGSKVRCFLGDSTPSSTDNTVHQILGTNYNLFCSQFVFELDNTGKVTTFVPGFSFLNHLTLVWIPEQLSMEISLSGEPVSTLTASFDQPISRPLSGQFPILKQVRLPGGVVITLTVEVTVQISAFPLNQSTPTWGYWVSHGETVFPMCLESVTPNFIKVQGVDLISIYDTLIDPLKTITTEENIRAIPFQANTPVLMYGVAQIQSASLVSQASGS